MNPYRTNGAAPTRKVLDTRCTRCDKWGLQYAYYPYSRRLYLSAVAPDMRYGFVSRADNMIGPLCQSCYRPISAYTPHFGIVGTGLIAWPPELGRPHHKTVEVEDDGSESEHPWLLTAT